MPSRCLLTRLRAPQRSQRPLEMTAWPDVRQRKRLCSRRDRGRFSRSTVGGRRSERLAAVALSFALRGPLSQPFQGFTSAGRPARRSDRPRDPAPGGSPGMRPGRSTRRVSSAIEPRSGAGRDPGGRGAACCAGVPCCSTKRSSRARGSRLVELLARRRRCDRLRPRRRLPPGSPGAEPAEMRDLARNAHAATSSAKRAWSCSRCRSISARRARSTSRLIRARRSAVRCTAWRFRASRFCCRRHAVCLQAFEQCRRRRPVRGCTNSPRHTPHLSGSFVTVRVTADPPGRGPRARGAAALPAARVRQARWSGRALGDANDGRSADLIAGDGAARSSSSSLSRSLRRRDRGIRHAIAT